MVWLVKTFLHVQCSTSSWIQMRSYQVFKLHLSRDIPNLLLHQKLFKIWYYSLIRPTGENFWHSGSCKYLQRMHNLYIDILNKKLAMKNLFEKWVPRLLRVVWNLETRIYFVCSWNIFERTN